MKWGHGSQCTYNQKRHPVGKIAFDFPCQVFPDDAYFLELLFTPVVPCGMQCAATVSKAKLVVQKRFLARPPFRPVLWVGEVHTFEAIRMSTVACWLVYLRQLALVRVGSIGLLLHILLACADSCRGVARHKRGVV